MRGSTFQTGSMLLAACGMLGFPCVASADVCNIKVVTDANPDYTDLGSMIHSMSDNWKEDRDKVWSVFYWNHQRLRLCDV